MPRQPVEGVRCPVNPAPSRDFLGASGRDRPVPPRNKPTCWRSRPLVERDKDRAGCRPEDGSRMKQVDVGCPGKFTTPAGPRAGGKMRSLRVAQRRLPYQTIRYMRRFEIFDGISYSSRRKFLHGNGILYPASDSITDTSNAIRFFIQKGLDKENAFPMFRAPFIECLTRNAREGSGKAEKKSVPSKTFFGKIREKY
jgi:hypothetical protein